MTSVKAECIGGPLDGQFVEIDPADQYYVPDGYEAPTPVYAAIHDVTYYVGDGWYQRATHVADGGHELLWRP